MKKKSLKYTLLVISFPLVFILLSHYLLKDHREEFYFQDFLIYRDILILLFSGLLSYFVFLLNLKKNQKINEKIIANNESVRLSNERYDIVAKATSDTIWDWDIISDIVYWNKGIQGIFGYKKKDVGLNSDWWFDIIHPEDRLRVSANMLTYREQKTERWREEYRLMCADGSYKYVLDRGFLVTDTDTNPTRMIGAIQDITQQKLEEKRLKLLETVIIQSKDSVIITKANELHETIPTIIYVNPAFSKITGFDESEVIGKPASTFFSKRANFKNYNKTINNLKNRQDFEFDVQNLKKTGEPYWMNLTLLSVRNSEKEHSYWISFQREITKEKENEKEKEQLINELTKNNKDLKQFSYITSHNLRAPLSNLMGLLEFSEDIEIENEELKTVFDGFSSSTKLLNETINDLVKVVVIKDSASIKKEKINLSTIIDSTIKQLGNQIELYQPEIKIKLEKSPTLIINKTFFESILLNLLTNALKYSSKDRPLKIKISSKEINNKIQLEFKDNGIGIDLDRNKEKVFGLYQRFHDYPDSKGLGLYLVKSQVETMGGKIEIESEVNVGTKFTLTFNKEDESE